MLYPVDTRVSPATITKSDPDTANTVLRRARQTIRQISCFPSQSDSNKTRAPTFHRRNTNSSQRIEIRTLHCSHTETIASQVGEAVQCACRALIGPCSDFCGRNAFTQQSSIQLKQKKSTLAQYEVRKWTDHQQSRYIPKMAKLRPCELRKKVKLGGRFFPSYGKRYMAKFHFRH